MRQIILFLLGFLLFTTGYSQSFKENSVGSLYLDKETGHEYDTEIVFPIDFLKDYEIERPITELKFVLDSFMIDSPIILFDSTGILGKLEGKKKVRIQFWCENDGGIQFRPTLNLKIDKGEMDRELKGNQRIERLACFALINNKNGDLSENNLTVSTDYKIEFKGDFDKNGKYETLIWSYPDDSGICKITYGLLYRNQRYYLNCCGP